MFRHGTRGPGVRERIGPHPFVRLPETASDPGSAGPPSGPDGPAPSHFLGCQTGRRTPTRKSPSSVNGRRSQPASSRSGTQPAVRASSRKSPNS